MYELISLAVGLTFWALVGWGAYRTYRAIARRSPALDRAVNSRARALRSALPSERGTTSLGVTYLWALGNHHARYRTATNDVLATSEEPRYLDAA
ncbi:MAG: hypothetical protein HOH95_00800 [Dehalococcoidia bacterium]|nr:hypothetical protein [Dehalococcoidia bacterium]